MYNRCLDVCEDSLKGSVPDIYMNEIDKIIERLLFNDAMRIASHFYMFYLLTFNSVYMYVLNIIIVYVFFIIIDFIIGHSFLIRFIIFLLLVICNFFVIKILLIILTCVAAFNFVDVFKGVLF